MTSAVAVLSASLLAACGTSAVADPATRTTDRNAVVVRVERAGGYTTRAFAVRILPEETIYADGRLVTPKLVGTPRARTAIDGVVVRRLDAEGLRIVEEQIKQSGFLTSKQTDFGFPGVTDLPTTTVNLSVGGALGVLSAYALDIPGEVDPGVTSAQHDARVKLRGLLEKMSDIDSLVGSDHISAAQPLPIDTFTIDSTVAPKRDGADSVKTVPWPVPDVDISLTDRCVEVNGDDASALRNALATESDSTEYTQKGVAYVVAIRPVLPGETPCAIAPQTEPTTSG